MARKSFSVLFFIKKGKLLKNGEAPVCMRITVNGCMVDISIKRSCPVNLWNQAKENSKGKDRMSVELNHYLEITRSHVHQIYRELETSGKVITVDLVRKLYYGVDEDNKTLLQVFREHNEQSRKLIGKDFVSKTVQRYETTTRYLEEFIKKEYQLPDIALNNLEANFISKFDAFLKIENVSYLFYSFNCELFSENDFNLVHCQKFRICIFQFEAVVSKRIFLYPVVFQSNTDNLLQVRCFFED